MHTTSQQKQAFVHTGVMIVGGLLAFLAVYFGRDMLPWADEITCTLATAIAAASAQMIGQRAGSAYAAKLSTVTFVLVVMGSKDAPSAQ